VTPESSDTIPLFTAATLAYDRVFSTRRSKGGTPTVDELDLVALALSTRLAIYGVRAAGREPSRLSDEELTRGMFFGGAMRFELGEGFAAVTKLAVRKADLERVLDELRRRPMDI
jgi:hypothetical protein